MTAARYLSRLVRAGIRSMSSASGSSTEGENPTRNSTAVAGSVQPNDIGVAALLA